MCGIHQRRAAMFVYPLLFHCIRIRASVCALCEFIFGVNVLFLKEILALLCRFVQRLGIVCSVIISRLHYSNYCRGTITTLTNARPSGLLCLLCVCVYVCKWMEVAAPTHSHNSLAAKLDHTENGCRPASHLLGAGNSR